MADPSERPSSGSSEPSEQDGVAPPLKPAGPVVRDRRSVQDDMRYRVLRTLESNPKMSQRALARELNVSLGALHYCLHALMEKGLVKARTFAASPRKTAYSYVLTPAGLSTKSALTRDFLSRKRAEYAALRAEIEALESELGCGDARSADLGTRG